MSYELNSKLSSLEPYSPIEGNYNIRCDANESFYNINYELGDIIADEIKKISLNRYPDPMATASVKAFSDFYGLDTKNVVAGNGSDELISILTSCFLEKGETVVTLSSDFSMYAFYSSLYEAQVEVFQKNNDFTVNIDNLIDFCNEKNARMLIFSNPCNPTSLGINKEDVIRIIDGVNALVVLDEAYMDFWDQSLLAQINDFDNLVILKTCSKAIGLAGLRFGYAVSCEKIINTLRTAKSPYNTDIISQKITEIVLAHKDILRKKIVEIIKNTESLKKSIMKLSVEYSAFEEVYNTKTNFIYIKTKYADRIAAEMAKRLIAIRKFNGFLRISTGSLVENCLLISSLEEIIKDIK